MQGCRVWPGRNGWCSSAAATRRSTRGCGRWSSIPNCRSATTCCREGRCRRWSSSRRSRARSPGVVGRRSSVVNESFRTGLLDHPHYTRPAVVEGVEVPEVLRSGDHERIDRWRREQALEATRRKRPDLLGRGRLRAGGCAQGAEQAIIRVLPLRGMRAGCEVVQFARGTRSHSADNTAADNEAAGSELAAQAQVTRNARSTASRAGVRAAGPARVPGG